MRQLKVSHISWRKCVMSFIVNTWSVKVTYGNWKALFNVWQWMRHVKVESSAICLLSCCQLVTSRHICMQGCSSIGRSLWWHAHRREHNERNNGLILKCCNPHHYTSTSSHAKNRYYTKSDARTPISLLLLRTGGTGECWTANLKAFVSRFLGFSLKRTGTPAGSKGT